MEAFLYIFIVFAECSINIVWNKIIHSTDSTRRLHNPPELFNSITGIFLQFVLYHFLIFNYVCGMKRA